MKRIRRLKPLGNTLHKCLQALVWLVFTLPGGALAAEASGQVEEPAGVRIATAVGGFNEVRQYAALYHFASPPLLQAEYMELAVGAIDSRADTRAFIAFGPVWRFRPAKRFYVDLGVSPTLLGGSTLGDRDLGGNIHFTSSATLGTRFGVLESYGLALRIQHISNAGLNKTNPGLDAIALSFTTGF